MPIADEIKELLQEGKLEKGLKKLNDWAAQNDDSLHNTTILLLSRFNQLKRNTTMGIISSSDAQRSRNQLSYAVLSTLDDLPEDAKAAVLPAVAGHAGVPAPAPQNEQKKVFISYARDDRPWVDKLEKHFASLQRSGLIDAWTDSEIRPGQSWNDSIMEELRKADLYIFMVSADFIASEFINAYEVPAAMKRNKENGTPIIPVIVRPCAWYDQPYSKFQALPANAKPIAVWDNEDEAFVSVVNGLKKLIVM